MLSKRLLVILRNVSCDYVADIGTDHAFIPVELAKKGVKVVATDVNAGPLHAAEKNVRKSGLPIKLLLGDGLRPIAKEGVKEIIIAGMGGELIKKIIADSLETAYSARLLLQPMNTQSELRRFLIEYGFIIEGEDLAAEGHKIYNLILARKGNMPMPSAEIDLHLPPILYRHPLFPMLLAKKEREFSKQLAGLSKSKNKDSEVIKTLEGLLLDIEKIKKKEL